MLTARHIKSIVLLMLIVAAFGFPKVSKAAAGSPTICNPSSSCTVGEFLYDDSYAPINSADCKLTSRYPDGTSLFDNQTMSIPSQSDGWYSYEFTAPSTTGYYRAQVCCTVGTDYLCIDKSFEVKESNGGGGATADEVANAVWGYSDRTLSGFGSLVSDIWNNSDRTLSSFGTLTRDIWLNASRTLTGEQGTNLENMDNNGDLAEIEKTVKENRLLLEKLVNQPIIQNFLEEENAPDVGEKLNETEDIVSALYINEQFLTSKTTSTMSNWNKLSDSEVLDIVMELNNLLGNETDSPSNNSIFAQVNWLKKSWGWTEVNEVSDQTLAVKKSIEWSQNTLATQGKTKAVYAELKSVSRYLDTLEVLLGDSTSATSSKTLYGKMKETKELSSVLDKREGEIDNLITNLNTGNSEKTEKEGTNIFKNILAVNKIPNANIVLNSKYKDLEPAKLVKNKLLGMKALVQANRKLLAKAAGEPISSTWLEEGSIVFKSVVTNPSKLVEQEVPLKYYLPPEVKEEDILDIDEGLTKNYDADKNQYYVEGTFTLAPGETKTLSVRVEDIWVITPDNVDSLRKQATELAKPLEGTSYFAQGVTLTSDINVSLDKILALQKGAITPEQKIRAYREAAIELEGVKEKMAKLQDLVTQAGSAGTLFGFVGGAQAVAVWGLIIIMATGFVFLALYMKQIQSKGKKAKKTESDHKSHNGKSPHTPATPIINGGYRPSYGRFVFPLVLVVSIISSAVTGFVVYRMTVSSVNEKATEVETVDSSKPEVMGEEKEKVNSSEDSKGGEDIVKVEVSTTPVLVYSSPQEDSEVIFEFEKTTEVKKVEEFEGWEMIAFEDSSKTLEGWIKKSSIVEPEKNMGESTGSVLIKETPTGWLRVRKSPGGIEVSKVDSGESFKLLAVEGGWYQIELSEDQTGWVSKEYVELQSE